MPPEVALFVAAAYLSIYLFLCSLSCGAALVQLFPRLGPNPPQTFTLRPEWEYSNIFLVFGLTTAIIFFGNVIDILGHAIMPVLYLLLLAVVMKAGLLMFIHFRKPARGLSATNAIFVLANFSVPLILAHLGYYMLSGTAFWESASGWAVMAATFTAIAAMGLVPPLKAYGSKQYWILSGFVYVLTLTPIVLAWGNMPYLVYKNLTVTQAFSAPLYGDLILLTLILALPIAIVGFPQMAKLIGPK